MEHEEREEIPWSSLIPAAEQGTDRRWFVAGLAVAALVLGIFGWRFLSGHSEGDPGAEAAALPAAITTTTTIAEPQLVVAESSLVSTEAEPETRAEVARAEWFVADFFTRDGGGTPEDIARAVVPELASSVIAAHAEQGESETYVEWSRASTIEVSSGDEVTVVVAYRAIAATPDGYDRLPVTFVALDIRTVDGVPLVSSLPVDVPAWSAPS